VVNGEDGWSREVEVDASCLAVTLFVYLFFSRTSSSSLWYHMLFVLSGPLKFRVWVMFTSANMEGQC